MLRRSNYCRSYPDAIIPTSHHETHWAAHSSIPGRPQARSIIEHLGFCGSSHKTPDLRYHLNGKWTSENGLAEEVVDLRKEVEHLRKEPNLSRQWMQLCTAFHRQDLSPHLSLMKIESSWKPYPHGPTLWWVNKLGSRPHLRKATSLNQQSRRKPAVQPTIQGEKPLWQAPPKEEQTRAKSGAGAKRPYQEKSLTQYLPIRKVDPICNTGPFAENFPISSVF